MDFGGKDDLLATIVFKSEVTCKSSQASAGGTPTAVPVHSNRTWHSISDYGRRNGLNLSAPTATPQAVLNDSTCIDVTYTASGTWSETRTGNVIVSFAPGAGAGAVASGAAVLKWGKVLGPYYGGLVVLGGAVVGGIGSSAGQMVNGTPYTATVTFVVRYCCICTEENEWDVTEDPQGMPVTIDAGDLYFTQNAQANR
jgi:hypothetical protein